MNQELEVATVIQRMGNSAVVQLEGRKFPALAMQGDSFHSMTQSVKYCLKQMREATPSSQLNEAIDELEQLHGVLEHALEFYKEACLKHKGTLPFTDERS
jgi:hypothetical protein